MMKLIKQNRRHVALGILAMAAVISCSKDPIDEPFGPDLIFGPSPEKLPGHGEPGFEPAFKEQTRAPGITTQTEWDFEIVVQSDEIVKPWGMKFISENQLLVLQKNKVMRIVPVDDPWGYSAPLDGFPTAGVQGTFDVVLDKDFETNKTIYFSYSKGPEGATQLTIARARLDVANNRLTDVREIYQAVPIVPKDDILGGRMYVDPVDGYLYIGAGDRNQEESRYMAQNLDASLGKIIRIDGNGNPAPNNPYINVEGALPEIWAIGIRSPLGFSTDPVTGNLWEVEHGPKGGDELNILEPGKNYGWPIISYGVNDDGTNLVSSNKGISKVEGSDPVRYELDPDNPGEYMTQYEGMEQPRYYWDPVIAPGHMIFYEAKGHNAVKEWDNNLFVTGLGKYERGVGNYVGRFVLSEDRKKIIGEERFLFEERQRLRSMAIGPDGSLYIATDEIEGRIYRLFKK